MGLSDSYSQAKSQILLMQQIPSINQVYAMINLNESQKMLAGSSRVMSDNLMPTTMFTSKNNHGIQRQKKNYNPNVFCDLCRMEGHSKIDYNKLMKYDFFHKNGHVKDDCYRLIGYPHNYKGNREAVVAENTTYNTANMKEKENTVNHTQNFHHNMNMSSQQQPQNMNYPHSAA